MYLKIFFTLHNIKNIFFKIFFMSVGSIIIIITIIILYLKKLQKRFKLSKTVFLFNTSIPK